MTSSEGPSTTPASLGRYLAYARCASHEQAEAQLDAQIRCIRAWGDRHRLDCVGEVCVAGVSGLTPVLRPDLRAILRRKRQHNDFDLLVMVDGARLTRAGLALGRRLEALFARQGVPILYVGER